MKLEVGQSLVSVGDSTAVIVIRAQGDEVELTCGGQPMVDAKSEQARGPRPTSVGLIQTELGKRYIDRADQVELLCTKGGALQLAISGELMSIKATKPLPASD